jgi:uncharacterized membrane protein YedE/YeeE
MLLVILLGVIFGLLLQYARLNRFDTISGMAILKDYSVAKAIALAIGVGAILINIEIALGLATFHVKPLLLTGVVVGGLIFGAGMAILGYCPGTMAVSLGEGSVDALIGIVGGFCGGAVYTLLHPGLSGLTGPDLGIITLNTIIGNQGLLFFLLLLLFSASLIFISFKLHSKEKNAHKKWIFSGIGLAILNAAMFLPEVVNKGLGASTCYPYIGDWIAGLTENAYFEKITSSGKWQIYFLGGALLAGLIMALIQKRFKITLIHDNWKNYKNNSPVSRIIWAFIGGFILIFGARLGGGCTSGHVLTGGMQVSISSLIFALFVFAGLLITGRIFYRK